MKENKVNAVSLSFAAMMAAMVYVVTLFRFPLLGSKVHLANAVCLLSGLLLGPVWGGVAAGLGSALYDALAGGYDLANVLITFVSKFAMAWVCGWLFHREKGLKHPLWRLVVPCVIGALTYVALYMLKTLVFQLFVYGYPMETAWVTMLSKLVPSLINAAAAMVAAPVFYQAVMPALRGVGVLQKIR